MWLWATEVQLPRPDLLGDAGARDSVAQRRRGRTPECTGTDQAKASRPLRNETRGPSRKKILCRRPGWPLDRFSTVERAWDGGCFVIIGGGPSLTAEQCELVRQARAAEKVRVIAVNDAYLWCPWADVCYFADTHWWQWHTKGIPKPKLGFTADEVRERFAAFAGQKCTIQQTGALVEDPEVHMLRNQTWPEHRNGISTDPDCLVTGWNGGHQALNLGILAGGKLGILLGIDGGRIGDCEHFHGDHPAATAPQVYDLMCRAFRHAAPIIKKLGVRILNSSPGSHVDAFERVPLEDALEIAGAPLAVAA